MSSVILKPGRERRLMAGHPWVYTGEIHSLTGTPVDGDAVGIRDHKNRSLGVGLLNQKSQIAVRRFSIDPAQEIDQSFLAARIKAAWDHRRACLDLAGVDAPDASVRVVFSESDLTPGLILDKYGDHVVVQTLTLGMDQRKGWVIEVARDLFHPVAIIERNDVPSRRLEGLDQLTGVIHGKSSGMVQAGIRLGPGADQVLKFDVNLLEDQKTGLFLDQSVNYREVARHCAGKRVLDCFSYHGAFAIAAARAGASHVEAVEISEAAVARARRNAELNGVTGKIEFVTANAFDLLKKSDAEKRTFDVIVLDPPTFTRTKQNVNDAVRGYKEINLRALKMLKPGGVLATFSCSHHIHPEMLQAVIVDAAADARKMLRLIKRLWQSPDHPILPAVPETEYLKGFLVEVI
jgi:23S rRNA (cytosine1962-C5)-methyltransferase